MKKTLLAALAAAAVVLTGAPSGTAASAPVHTVTVIKGHGIEACPGGSFCLYRHEDYNGETDADIVVVHTSEAGSQEIDLEGTPAYDFGRSAVLTDRDFANVKLSPNSCADFGQPTKDWSYVSFFHGGGIGDKWRRPSLDNREGLSHKASWWEWKNGAQVPWSRYDRVDLNNRAGCLLYDVPLPGTVVR
ncbi:hypothetical protein ABT160_32840 [Streptomyces sp. NPDC001941]|uniref:hypothetical protein n=1 Tax=Streptomyces sp. NPDC001941 TaxID=3154659 RepID=UPI00332C538B